MSATLQIKFEDRGGVLPGLRTIGQVLRSSDVRAVMGKALKIEVQTHLQNLDRDRANPMGGRRTHFYAQAAQGTTFIDDSANDEITIAISQVGFAQRYFGGTIKAGVGVSSKTGKTTQWLAIPARTETYGKRPGEFTNLHFIAFKSGAAALVENENTLLGKKRGGGYRAKASLGGGVFFWLVKSVTQKPDPTVLPDESKLTDAAYEAAGDYLEARDASS